VRGVDVCVVVIGLAATIESRTRRRRRLSSAKSHSRRPRSRARRIHHSVGREPDKLSAPTVESPDKTSAPTSAIPDRHHPPVESQERKPAPLRTSLFMRPIWSEDALFEFGSGPAEPHPGARWSELPRLGTS